MRLLFVLFTLVMFAGQTTGFFVLSTIGSDDCGQSCPQDDSEKDCSCPIPCAPCCAGNALLAIPPSWFEVSLLGPATGELIGLVAEQVPLSTEPAEILHVPKPPRA